MSIANSAGLEPSHYKLPLCQIHELQLDKVDSSDAKKENFKPYNHSEALGTWEHGTFDEKAGPEWRSAMAFVGAETMRSLGSKRLSQGVSQKAHCWCSTDS